MLVIKLQRRGKKHQPSYRVVVQEKHSKLNGDFIDDLGSYDPKSKEAQIKGDRVAHWISVGAKATPTVNNLLIKKGIITGEKIPVHKFMIKEKIVPAPVVEVKTEPSLVEDKKVEEKAPEAPVEAPVEAPKEEPKVAE